MAGSSRKLTADPEMISSKLMRASEATTSLRNFVGGFWDAHRSAPGINDFTFGNPQELAIPGFAKALAANIEPLSKDWYAYKWSEPEARQTVAKHLSEWRGMPFAPEDIALTPGAFGAIATAFNALISPGEELIISVPPWFFYEATALMAGAVPVKVPIRAENHDLDVDRIASVMTPKTRMVIVNTPNNPTGRIYPATTLTDLADALSEASNRHGAPIYLLSDEPYARLVYSDATFVNPASFYPHTLISYSYGKVLLTPGERIGWLALSPNLPEREQLRPFIELAQMASGWLFPSALLQHSIEDLEGLSIDLVELERKRDVMGDALLEMGYELNMPEGTFYLWVRSPDPDDYAFAAKLADQGVLVLPGVVSEGPGYFRISLTATMEMIERSLPVFASARH